MAAGGFATCSSITAEEHAAMTEPAPKSAVIVEPLESSLSNLPAMANRLAAKSIGIIRTIVHN